MVDKLKVLIIDDDISRKKDITEIIENSGLAKVVRIFSDAALALEWLKHNSVQVVFINVLAVQEDIAYLLKSIKEANHVTEVLLICDGTPLSTELTMLGLHKGAVDFIKLTTPSPTLKEGLKNQLVVLFSQIMIKINSIEAEKRRPLKPYPAGAAFLPAGKEDVKQQRHFDPSRWNKAELILITASTGGPMALEEICSYFPASFDTPILIVQHIPPEFTAVMVDSLGKKCSIPLSEGRDKDIITPRHVYIAPGGIHMIVERGEYQRKIIRLIDSPPVNAVRPSADVLFASVAASCQGSNVLAVVLTGMGHDGKDGIFQLKQKCNCYCLVQSEESCVIYGMPRSVNEAGLADEVVVLPKIARRICELATKGIDKT